ncbi:ABC transporter permease [Limosilactobacillus equigenerosi]|uniref:ABC transporter permease component n=1 Tax=Limosilactobacillus equigenerosi DSM 18793 = JCM 14505 TaxID=1423742 RepID=A0A0R1V0C8_9LACO|nr:ABC transporter permease [Limosilactobacillus equigenerosi]KRL96309.1 ABC transporter permease component [Limosilactobacillus equigenerosi DSM 18793 = JCM 14505]
MTRLLALTNRILKQLIRDKRTIALMLVAPILIMFLLNIVFTTNTKPHIKLATSQVNATLVSQLDATKHVSVKQFTTKQAASQALKKHQVDATLIGQNDQKLIVTYANTDSAKTQFTRQILQSTLAKTSNQQLFATVSKLAQATGQSLPAPAQVKITQHYVYGNEDTGFFSKIIPILLAFFIFFFVFLISGMALLGERTSGTLDRLLATPIKRSEIIGGYMLSYGIAAVVQTTVIVLATIWLLHLEVVGNIGAIIVVAFLTALVALSFGILLSTFAGSEFQMMQFIPLVVVPQIFFSGIIPLDTMANWAQWIGTILPIKYAGDALSQIILQGATLTDVIGDLGALLIFIVILTAVNIIGLKRYRKV